MIKIDKVYERKIKSSKSHHGMFRFWVCIRKEETLILRFHWKIWRSFCRTGELAGKSVNARVWRRRFCLRSHDAVGDVLEGVVEFGGDGAHWSVHHLLHQQLQLLLGQRHVESLLQAADGAGAVETGKVGTWKRRNKNKGRYTEALKVNRDGICLFSVVRKFHYILVSGTALMADSILDLSPRW